MTSNSTRKSLRITGIVLLILLAVGGIAALWFQSNYKQIIQNKLPIISKKVTDSLYKIKAGDVDISLPDRRVVITDFELVPDPDHIQRLQKDFRLPKMLLRIHVDKVTMDDIDWSTVLSSKEVVCGSMKLEHPVVSIVRIGDADSTGEKEVKEPSAIQAIRAKVIDILNPEVLYSTDTTKRATKIALKGGSIRLREWNYDLRNPADTTRLFYAANTAANFKSFDVQTADGVYAIRSGDISYDQSREYLGIRGFELKPKISREAFYRRANVQKEIYDMRIPGLDLEGIDWRALLYRGSVIVRGGALNDAHIGIYMSRIPPLNMKSKNGNFPQQMLMKLALPVSIPTMSIRNGSFAYTEKNERSMQEGTVAMTKIGGRITNLTNMPALLRRNKTLTVAMEGLFKESPIRAQFDFNIPAKDGAFRVKGGIGAMDGTKLNDIVQPLALAEIRELQIQKIDFDVQGSEAGAKGSMTMLYEGLKVALLKPDDGKLEKQDLTSFLANGLLIHNSNTGNRPRRVNPEFMRDETKSFFNLVWKTIFTGTLQTASRKLIKLDRVVNNRAEKKEAARRENELQGRK
jgi:hypothetical protein